MGNPITEEKEITLLVKGNGDTKEKALSAAFSGIKQSVSGIPLRIEPLDVEIVKAVEEQYTERFLFLFFKRTRSTFYIELNVKVHVVNLELDSIPFQLKTQRLLLRAKE